MAGVMRRRIDLRWRITYDEIVRLRETQLGLLDIAAQVVTLDLDSQPSKIKNQKSILNHQSQNLLVNTNRRIPNHAP
jgi:hypothetical protein